MAWRKWLVRGFVFSVLAGAALGALAYQHWTSPETVRELVLAKARALFPGAAVLVDSARLHLLGWIQVQELKLVRTEGQHEVIHVPSAVLYHNKEKMLEGEMSLRKVELHRPRLRILCDEQGRWNVKGLIAPSDPTKPLPTLVIHQATVLVDDRRDPAHPVAVELRDVNLTLINDPLPTVTIDGVAQCECLGKVQLRAVWQRATDDLSFTLRAADTAVSDKLLARLGCLCSAAKVEGVHVEGQAALAIQGAYRAAETPAFRYEVQVELKKAKLQHPSLPLPLEDLDATLHVSAQELRLERGVARFGAASVRAHGAALLPAPDQDFEATVTIERLALNEEFAERLPPKLQAIHRLFEPRGPATIRLECARQGGQWVKLASGQDSALTVTPENIAVTFARFPYPLKQCTGTIACSLLSRKVTVDATAQASDRTVTVRGHWQGEGAQADAHFDIAAVDVPIEPALLAAIQQPCRRYLEAFNATGRVDVKARWTHRPGQAAADYDYVVNVHDASARWAHFPIPLVEVQGVIALTPQHWEFRDFRGRHGAGTVALSGRSLGDPLGDDLGMFVEISGKNLELAADLRQALTTMPALAKAWDKFQPSGQLWFTAAIERRGPTPADLDVRVEVKGPTIRPAFVPYAVHDVAGFFHFHDLRLDLRRLSAVHDEARFYLERGVVELHPHGALYIDLPDLQAQDFRIDKDLIAALPPRLREVADTLACDGPLRLKTRVVVAHEAAPGSLPDVFWDGQLWLDEAKVQTGVELRHVTGVIACAGRHNGRQLTGLTGNAVLERVAVFNQPFRKVTSQFHILEKEPELLQVSLKAPIFGGDVTGQATLDFRATPRFDLNLTASQIDLQEFGRYNLGPNSQISGVAVGRLVLSGVGNDAGTLDGHGTVDVPNGKLLNLPLLLDLIKFLGLRWPDRTMFEEAHAQFAIRGRRVRVGNLELFGNAVSFTGKGDVNLDGTDLAVELYPSWARIEQLLPPVVRSVPPALSKNILTVEAKGKISGNPSDLKFMKKPMPIIVDPLLNLRDRVLGERMPAPTIEPRGPMPAAPMPVSIAPPLR